MDPSDESDEECELLERMVIARRPRTLREAPTRLGNYDEKSFRERFGITKQAAWMVLTIIRDKIQRKIPWNNALIPEEMLLLTLRFYATGCMQRTGGDLMGVSPATASRVIRLVSHHIALLRGDFISFPATEEEKRRKQQRFYLIAKFPRVVAALDCTHVKIISPGGDDAELYRNRKGFFSYNVQTMCDSDLNILDIVARWPGSTHDATILRNSRIYSRLEDGEFGNSLVVADSGYPCNQWIMTPIANVCTHSEALYNESQIRTRNCVERSYGIWKRRFPVLSLGIRLHIKRVESVVVATAVLHNICNQVNEKSAPPVSREIRAHIEDALSMPSVLSSNNNSSVGPTCRTSRVKSLNAELVSSELNC